jgi:hypothetical protein
MILNENGRPGYESRREFEDWARMRLYVKKKAINNTDRTKNFKIRINKTDKISPLAILCMWTVKKPGVTGHTLKKSIMNLN